eukprot:5489284-Pyramimonas_sp.AAC.1
MSVCATLAGIASSWFPPSPLSKRATGILAVVCACALARRGLVPALFEHEAWRPRAPLPRGRLGPDPPVALTTRISS